MSLNPTFANSYTKFTYVRGDVAFDVSGQVRRMDVDTSAWGYTTAKLELDDVTLVRRELEPVPCTSRHKDPYTKNITNCVRLGEHTLHSDTEDESDWLWTDEGAYLDETPPTSEADEVNHPSHYTSHPSGVECITITEHMTFCAGNAVKYLWRAGLKDCDDSNAKKIEDLRKAAWYATREADRLERDGS